jgi:hypothetical protein
VGHYERILEAFPDELEPEPPPFSGWDLGTRKNNLRNGEGRVVLASRGKYDHVGLDMGDDSVIHWTGELVAAAKATIERTTQSVFARGEAIRYADLPHMLIPISAASWLGRTSAWGREL